jgi:prepilin-type processing-associated H-X9-DG protein
MLQTYMPHAQNDGVTRCPSNASTARSYGYDLRTMDIKSLGVFKTPSQKMAFTDHDSHAGGYLRYNTCGSTCPNAGNLDSHVAGHNGGDVRHNGGTNVAFVDGHTEAMKLEQVIVWIPSTSSAQYLLWNL